MSKVQDHYSNLLAKHYSWMFGMPFATKVAEQKTILKDALQRTEDSSDLGLAVDLGSGPGFQTIALSEIGYSPVLAVDSSEALLKELQTHQAVGLYKPFPATYYSWASLSLQRQPK